MKAKKLFLPIMAALALFFAQNGQAADRTFPVPVTLSDRAAALVAAPPSPVWLAAPKDTAELQAFARQADAAGAKNAAALAEQLGVTIEDDTIAGIPVHILTPSTVDANKEDKVIYAIHGGGYVLGGGLAGTTEGLLMAAFNNYKVVAVDYRLAPEYPYPAAIDDAFAVYRELAKDYGAENIAVLGTSTGGAMTLILALQCLADGTPLPAALVSGTPWSELGKVGDSYFTNDRVDNVLVTYGGLLQACAEGYAPGEDYTNPLISPMYAGDDALANFPPTLLISGTRDLFLSNTVRMHERLLLNGVTADLVVYEAFSHAQYYFDAEAEETANHYRLIDMFLDEHLLRAGK